MEAIDIIAAIREATDCVVLPPQSVPTIRPDHKLPGDVRSFYGSCGGAVLFQHSSFPTFIVPPGGLVRANPVIVGEPCEYDISASWYIIASDGSDSQKMTIDLSEDRLGRCYDSFWDRHAVAGSSTIIARSFSEFVERSLASGGKHLYWLQEDFATYGDAYDVSR